MNDPARTSRLLRLGVIAGLLLLLGALAAGVADAAQKKKPSGKSLTDEYVYRCKSESGHSFFGQNIPPECMGADVEVLDETGRVVRMIPGTKSLEQMAAQKAAEDAKAAAAQRDKTLLATYLSVADIERLRDQRIELLEQQNVVTRQYITNLRARESRLMQSVQRFRPYSPKPNAPALPGQIANEIVNTVKGLQVYEEELAKNTVERERVAAEFGADISRFKELKGLK
ncbi:MAG: hypothetical protein OEW50_08140 [Gammaproteobacteria bacterium]|nr:hypothetical protein [Gammaproteobacteria bacterium]MDH5227353.1 hypothetical protein [Gammaproteobacteria bacterium]